MLAKKNNLNAKIQLNKKILVWPFISGLVS